MVNLILLFRRISDKEGTILMDTDLYDKTTVVRALTGPVRRDYTISALECGGVPTFYMEDGYTYSLSVNGSWSIHGDYPRVGEEGYFRGPDNNIEYPNESHSCTECPNNLRDAQQRCPCMIGTLVYSVGGGKYFPYANFPIVGNSQNDGRQVFFKINDNDCLDEGQRGNMKVLVTKRLSR